MSRLLVKLIRNKNNGQINLSIPKKKLDVDAKKKFCNAKKAWITLEGFE